MTTSTRSLTVADDPFEVTVIEPAIAERCVLFAAGRGGDPGRHDGLLRALAGAGALVIAPHFDMLPLAPPTAADLHRRTARMAAAWDAFCPATLAAGGVGHSIGAVVLLLLAGAEATCFTGETVTVPARRALGGLVLMTPPTAFFRPPGALDGITTPMQLWAGDQDAITPPSHAVFLRDQLAHRVPVQFHLVKEAGHFTFMDKLPPQVSDPHPDRAALLEMLAREANGFLRPSSAMRADAN